MATDHVAAGERPVGTLLPSSEKSPPIGWFLPSRAAAHETTSRSVQQLTIVSNTPTETDHAM